MLENNKRIKGLSKRAMGNNTSDNYDKFDEYNEYFRRAKGIECGVREDALEMHNNAHDTHKAHNDHHLHNDYDSSTSNTTPYSFLPTAIR